MCQAEGGVRFKRHIWKPKLRGELCERCGLFRSFGGSEGLDEEYVVDDESAGNGGVPAGDGG